MDYLDIKQIDRKKARLIGIGTTAYCYKLTDGSVLKLFKNNYSAKVILQKELFNEDINKLDNISNNTFVGPHKIIVKNDKIIGYTYPYIRGKNLYRINPKTPFKKLFDNYDQVLEDIKNITKQNFVLFDVHGGNIIFNRNIHIIDLDKCWFYKDGTKESLYLNNTNEIFRNIFGSIYHKRVNEDLMIVDHNLNTKYNKVKSSNIDSIEEFIEEIMFYCGEENPTIQTVREKIKVKKDLNGYFKM